MTTREPSAGPSRPTCHDADETLMVRVMGGDASAFEELFSRYSTRVRTFAYRFVGDRQWAEDLTQDVFLKIYRNPKAFDPRKRFLTWIFAVARNACIDFLRLKRLPIVHGSGANDDGPSLEPQDSEIRGPEALARGAEIERRLQEVLVTLSPKLRDVFVLCALEGLSYEDAAEVLACPVKTVSSRLCRARDRFQAAFARDPALEHSPRRPLR